MHLHCDLYILVFVTLSEVKYVTMWCCMYVQMVREELSEDSLRHLLTRFRIEKGGRGNETPPPTYHITVQEDSIHFPVI